MSEDIRKLTGIGAKWCDHKRQVEHCMGGRVMKGWSLSTRLKFHNNVNSQECITRDRKVKTIPVISVDVTHCAISASA